MMKNLCFGFLVVAFSGLVACGESAQEQPLEENVITPEEELLPDSAALAREALERNWEEALEEAREYQQRLLRLQRQLDDSIANTGVEPMMQEEMINNYRNSQLELEKAEVALQQWQEQAQDKAANPEDLQELQILLQSARTAVQESRAYMDDAAKGGF